MIFNLPTDYKYLAGIYIIRSLIDGRIYVGSAKTLYRRYLTHHSALRKNEHRSIHMQRFADQYGLNSLSFDLLEIVKDKTQLLIREQYYLDLYKPFGKDGFNTLTVAGSRLGAIISEESRLKISASNKGKIPHNAGIPMSEVQRVKLSLAKTGKRLNEEGRAKRSQSLRNRGFKPHNTGKPMTEDQKEHLRIKNTGKKLSTETKEKIAKSLIGNNRHPVKPVIMYSLDMQPIKEFKSVTDAAKEIGTSRSNINFCLNGTCKTAAGYVWTYKETA
jgi:group I intron endonuclease